MIDLAKLSSIDIKEIDWSKLQEKVMQRQDLAITVGMAFLTLIISFNMYTGKKNAAKSMRTQIISLEKNVKAVNALKQNQKKFDDYFESLTKGVSVDEIINQLTSMAITHNLQILSFSPGSKDSKGIFDQATVTIKVTAKSYQNIILFVQSIESSQQALKVDTWTGQLEAPARRRGRSRNSEVEEETQPPIYAEITVSSMDFKK